MKKFLNLATAVAAFATPALAQQGRPQRSPEEMEAAFTKADANKAGKLDKAEFKATLPEQFFRFLQRVFAVDGHLGSLHERGIARPARAAARHARFSRGAVARGE